MLLNNTRSVDMARFLLLMDEKYDSEQHIEKFRKLWYVLNRTIYRHEQQQKRDKLTRLVSNKQELAMKVAGVYASNESDANKQQKIENLQSYIRSIDSALRQLSR
ncbi:MAG: hypothetical protein ACLRFK_01240 [Alphaproteobacteria bacterium]